MQNGLDYTDSMPWSSSRSSDRDPDRFPLFLSKMFSRFIWIYMSALLFAHTSASAPLSPKQFHQFNQVRSQRCDRSKPFSCISDSSVITLYPVRFHVRKPLFTTWVHVSLHSKLGEEGGFDTASGVASLCNRLNAGGSQYPPPRCCSPPSPYCAPHFATSCLSACPSSLPLSPPFHPPVPSLLSAPFQFLPHKIYLFLLSVSDIPAAFPSGLAPGGILVPQQPTTSCAIKPPRVAAILPRIVARASLASARELLPVNSLIMMQSGASRSKCFWGVGVQGSCWCYMITRRHTVARREAPPDCHTGRVQRRRRVRVPSARDSGSGSLGPACQCPARDHPGPIMMI